MACDCCGGGCCCPGVTWPETLCATMTANGCACDPLTFTLNLFTDYGDDCPDVGAQVYFGGLADWCLPELETVLTLAHFCADGGGGCVMGFSSTLDDPFCPLTGVYTIEVLSCSPVHLRVTIAAPSPLFCPCDCDADGTPPLTATNTITVDIVEC